MKRPDNWKQNVLRGLITQLPSGSFQKNPYSPNLLNQPDLLVALAPGRMTAVFLYGQSQRLTWRSTLAAIEDLFEVKLHMGRSTTAMALDFSELKQDFEQDDMRRLLRNTFEAFIHVDITKLKISGGRFRTSVHDSTPRQDLFPLWEMEKEFVQRSLRRFNRDRYKKLVDKRRSPVLARKAAIRQVAAAIEEATGIAPESEPLVESMKDSLGSLSGTHKLGFDLMTREPMRVPIQIVSASRYGSRSTVRYLMSKARLMRYAGADGQLERLGQVVRPLMVVEGNLAGPDHDQFRYVRNLISVGWELVSMDSIHEFHRVVADANF